MHAKFFPSFCGAIFTAFAFSVAAGSAQVLLDENFEQPTISENTFVAITPTDWEVSGLHPGLLMNGNAGNSGIWRGPYRGAQYFDIGNNPNMWLARAFTVSASGNYVLSWVDNTGIDLGAPSQSSPYIVSVTNKASEFNISTNFDAFHSGAWQERSILLYLQSGTYTLCFSPQGGSQWLDTLLDDVKLEAKWVTFMTIQVSSVDICWNSRTNLAYQVQYRSVLTPDEWINLGDPVTGNGNTNCVTDFVRGTEKRFYRVEETPLVP